MSRRSQKSLNLLKDPPDVQHKQQNIPEANQDPTQPESSTNQAPMTPSKHYLYKSLATFTSPDEENLDWLKFKSSEFLAREIKHSTIFTYIKEDEEADINGVKVKRRYAVFEFNDGSYKHSESVEYRVFGFHKGILGPLGHTTMTDIIDDNKAERIDLKKYQDENQELVESIRRKLREEMDAGLDLSVSATIERKEEVKVEEEEDVRYGAGPSVDVEGRENVGPSVEEEGRENVGPSAEEEGRENVDPSVEIQEEGRQNEYGVVSSVGYFGVDPDPDPNEDPGQHPKLALFNDLWAQGIETRMREEGRSAKEIKIEIEKFWQERWAAGENPNNQERPILKRVKLTHEENENGVERNVVQRVIRFGKKIVSGIRNSFHK